MCMNFKLNQLVVFYFVIPSSLTACNASPPETIHYLQNPKWPPGGPKWPTGSGKRKIPRLLDPPINFCKRSVLMRTSKIQNGQIFLGSCHVSLNYFFDPITYSMRKVDNRRREKKKAQNLCIDASFEQR